MSLRRKFRADTTSLTQSLYIELPVSERSGICLLGVSIFAFISTNFLLEFGSVPTVWYVCFSFLLISLHIIAMYWKCFIFLMNLIIDKTNLHPFADTQSDIQNYIETLWCCEQRGHQQSHVSVPWWSDLLLSENVTKVKQKWFSKLF